MAKNGYSFPEATCQECRHHQSVGNLYVTRYCHGFKGKKAKRFRSSDPAYKPPKWCPKRLPGRVLRVYGFKSAQEAFMGRLMEYTAADRYACPISGRYKLRYEAETSWGAKQFYEESRNGPLEDAVGVQVDTGEVVEIDDGLKPYYFYCVGYGSLLPALGFTPPAEEVKGSVK